MSPSRSINGIFPMRTFRLVRPLLRQSSCVGLMKSYFFWASPMFQWFPGPATIYPNLMHTAGKQFLVLMSVRRLIYVPK